jgi:hypothetical protein
MKIITIERFGQAKSDFEEHRGFIYGGDAYMLRFTIKSPEHFFRTELERLCQELFSIDQRQIMEVTIHGGGFGLYDVRLMISFEEPPNVHTFDQLQLAVAEATAGEWPNDHLDSRFKEFLQAAKPALKDKIARTLQQEASFENRQHAV